MSSAYEDEALQRLVRERALSGELTLRELLRVIHPAGTEAPYDRWVTYDVLVGLLGFSLREVRRHITGSVLFEGSAGSVEEAERCFNNELQAKLPGLRDGTVLP